MVERTKRAIIWLEDHPDYFLELQEFIENCGFQLIICRTLEEFKKVTDNFRSDPELAAGFIIDVALRGNNDDLGALGFPHIMTHQGGVTGIQVTIHFLLGLHSEDESPFANIPISILTVLQDSDKVFRSLASPSPYGVDDETLAAMDKVKFIGKLEDSALNGGHGEVSTIKLWINSLRG